MLHRKSVDVTCVSLRISNYHELENMKNQLNNTLTPYNTNGTHVVQHEVRTLFLIYITIMVSKASMVEKLQGCHFDAIFQFSKFQIVHHL